MYPDWLLPFIEVADMSKDTIRSLAWNFYRWEFSSYTAMYQGFMDLFNLDLSTLSFVGTSNGIISKIVPVLFALCLVFGGFLLILNNQRAKKDLFSGVIVSVLLIALTPYTISTMGAITKLVTTGMTSIFVGAEADKNNAGGIYTKTDKDGTDFYDVLIQSGTVDVLASRQNGTLCYLAADPDTIDINTRVGGYFGHEDLFSTTKDGTPLRNGNWILPELTNEGLYRYQIDFIQVGLIGIVLFISMILAGVRAAATIYEIILNQLIAPIVYATDIMQTGRGKAFFQRIIATYLSLMIIIFSLLMYIQMTAWVMDYVGNWWAKFFLLVGFTMAMFNGPDSVIKLIGIDVGTRSGAAPFVSTAAVVSQAISLTSMAVSHGSNSGTSSQSASAGKGSGTRSAPETSGSQDGNAPTGKPEESSPQTSEKTSTHSDSQRSSSTQTSAPPTATPERSPSDANAPRGADASVMNAASQALTEAGSQLSSAEQGSAPDSHGEPAHEGSSPARNAPSESPADNAPRSSPIPYMAPPPLDFMPSHTAPSSARPTQSAPPEALTNAPHMPPPPPPQGGNRP